MNLLPSVRVLALTSTLALVGAGCSDDPAPAPTDSGSLVDAATDLGADVPRADVPRADVPAADVPATDVPAADVPAADVPATDVPATDVPATDVPAADVPATDVPATDVPATDVPATDGGDALAALCTSTGGTIDTATCCLSASDFPNRCALGGCSCGPGSTHTIRVCNCPSGMCFTPASGCGAM